jgi:hypothetical protein
MALDQYGSPQCDRDGNLWIRLTVCGVTRLGVGDGKNMKERIGDAIRNAAMRFGVALDLWAKENLVEFATRTRGQLFALFGQKGIAEPDQLPGINHITGKAYTSRADLTEDDAKKVIAALKKRPDAVDPEKPGEVARLQDGAA